MKDEIPEAFRHVELWDSDTWANATLEEWIEMRAELLAKKEGSAKLKKLWSQYFKVRREALVRLRKGKRLSHRKPLTGRQRARLEELLKSFWISSADIPEGFSMWEVSFLRHSAWLDDLLAGKPSPEMPQLQSTLFRWILQVEKDTELRRTREDWRQRQRASVAERADPGTRLPRRENAYLPHPLELIGIYRRALLVITDIKRGLDIGQQLGVYPDEYGAAYPCPVCAERYDIILHASKCCPDGIGGEEKQILRQYTKAVVIQGPKHKRIVDDFISMLWKLGYETPVTVEQLMAWRKWPDIESKSTFEFTRRFVGKVFSACPDTIRKKISKGVLAPLYHKKKYNVALDLRFFLDGTVPSLPNTVYGKGWYKQLDRTRRPRPDCIRSLQIGSIYGP